LERGDGSWAAFEVALLVSRQNGKGSVLAARELAGLFLFGEELIIHTAHQYKTSHEAFLRIAPIIANSPDLMRRVRRMPSNTSEEGVVLKDGRRLLFLARSGASGRGFSGDCVILDEAYDLTGDQMAALLPTLSARPNPQIWYTSSAPMEKSAVLHAVRDRALAGGSPRLSFMEWSAPEGCDPGDRAAWAQANPALGIRIDEEFVAAERDALPEPEFARERLGIPDRPAGGGVFPAGAWDALADIGSRIDGTVTFAVEIAEDRSWSCIAAAGTGPSGVHVEYVDYRRETGWLVGRLVELTRRARGSRVVVQPSSAAGALIGALEAAGVPLLKPTAQEYAQACGQLFDAVIDKELRHLAQPALDVSVQGAQKKPAADAWVWNRRNPALDISPLVAVTLAAWGARQQPPRPGRFMAF
jgi:phage terminase large subunit-like protein